MRVKAMMVLEVWYDDISAPSEAELLLNTMVRKAIGDYDVSKENTAIIDAWEFHTSADIVYK